MSRAEWVESDHTRQLVEDLKDTIETIKESWAAGEYTGGNADQTIQLNAKALGSLEICESLLERILKDD